MTRRRAGGRFASLFSSAFSGRRRRGRGAARGPGRAFRRLRLESFEPRTLLASISGTVFDDLTGNGFTPDDSIRPDSVVLRLLDDIGGLPVATTTSNPLTGRFTFDGLDVGTYFVRADAPLGATQTAGPAYYTITVAATDQVEEGRDFGFFTPARVSGTKTLDTDQDGEGDEPQPDVPIRLYLDNGNEQFDPADPSDPSDPGDQLLNEKPTDADGQYTFENLDDGFYFIEEDVPDGFVPVGPTVHSFEVVNDVPYAAGSLPVDSFDDPGSADTYAIKALNSSPFTSPASPPPGSPTDLTDMERVLVVEVIGTPGMTSASGSIGAGTYNFGSNGPAPTTATLTYTATSPTATVDLTNDDANTAVRFDLIILETGVGEPDLDFSVEMTGGGDTATFSGAIPNDPNNPTSYVLPFSAFTTTGSLSPEEVAAQVDEIVIVFNDPAQPDVDFILDSVVGVRPKDDGFDFVNQRDAPTKKVLLYPFGLWFPVDGQTNGDGGDANGNGDEGNDGADAYGAPEVGALGESTIDLVGTAGDDTLSYDARTGDVTLVTGDGRVRTLNAKDTGLEFDGSGGSDTATIIGTEGSEDLALGPDSALLVGDGFRVHVVGAEQVTVDGLGGDDTLTVTDSGGDDEFRAGVEKAWLIGDGFWHEAHGFETQTASSAVGGFDIAYLYDSPKDDTFTATPRSSTVESQGFRIEVDDFEAVHVYATAGGDDVARLHDSPGDDTFVGGEIAGALYGPGYYNRAKFFESVEAYAGYGIDEAKLYDSPGDDTFVGAKSTSVLYGAAYHNQVKFFDSVEAYAGDGFDEAKLYDSPGDDTFEAGPSVATLSGAGFSNRANGFEAVHGYSTVGGSDIARLRGTAGDDHLMADDVATHLWDNGYYLRAKLFEEVYAEGAGGHDTADLYDSAGDDFLSGGPGLVSLLWDSGLALYVEDFDALTAVSSHGGMDQKDPIGTSYVDHILTTVGPWL